MKHPVAKHFSKCLTFKHGSGFTWMLGWSLQLYITLGHTIRYRSLEGLQKSREITSLILQG